MKIIITEEQKAKMDAIFANMDALSNDKAFMKMLKYTENSYDDAMKNEANSEDDILTLINFTENIIDTAKCNFNYHNI